MTKLTPPPGLHVILGGSAGGIFNRNYSRRDLLIDEDVLSVGPTPRCENFDAWNTLREQFWSTCLPAQLMHPVENIARHPDRLRAAGLINLWAATGVSEQLFIAFSLHVIGSLGIDPARLRLLQFEQLPGRKHPRIVGMGELNEANMANHPPPRPFTPDGLDDYRAAWSALTSSDPTPIVQFATTRPTANHWLEQAMHLMLRRFPDRTSGLTHWDQLLLMKVPGSGPTAGRVIAHAMTHDRNDTDPVGDAYLLGRLKRMADKRQPKPLLELVGDLTSIRYGDITVALTPFGRDVLDSKASSYPANPIDDWAAGVHLSSIKGQLWFREGDRLVPATH
jgi:hypothetical protein